MSTKQLMTAVASLVLWASCDGQSTPASLTCGRVAPCGGDLVGTWTFAATCNNSGALAGGASGGIASMCADAAIDTSNAKVTGSYNVKADKTYTADLTFTGSVGLSLPTSCFAQLAVSCAQLGLAASVALTQDPSSGFQSANCKDAAKDGCDCTLAYNGKPIHQTGTYATSGNNLTLSHDGTDDVSQYCVQGNQLHMISSVGSTMGVMSAATIDLVLTR